MRLEIVSTGHLSSIPIYFKSSLFLKTNMFRRYNYYLDKEKGIWLRIEYGNVIIELLNDDNEQIDYIKRYIEKIYNGKVIVFTSNDSCDWMDKIKNVRAYRL